MENQKSGIRNQESGIFLSKREEGYTLLEVLIYSSILALFLLLTTQLFISIKLTNAHSIALVGLQKNCRQIIADLTPTIKAAENVMTPLPGETATTLSLNNGTILYQIENGVLQKIEDSQVWELTTNEVTVSGLSFENPIEATQTANIKIVMTVESNYLLEGGRKLSEILQTTVDLR